ncbi:Uncharacterised protein [Aedoeadaptatus ivorii]|uniref:Uncharacterized protein n=1 Tax=Aedoeadaptatus ivorii TaxID=54006 RepID=A0A3S4YL68_9FIRM|nr:hypothetical protein [Peptoniphilus ivorii]VEJ35915.1 Uncharacterised protein [Peptoniphilus ivorii]
MNVTDKKKFLMFAIVGPACIILRALLGVGGMEVKQTPILVGAGAILAIIGFLLYIYEKKHIDEFAYAYAENWNGGGFINSAFILGISVFFFAMTWIKGIAILVLFGVVYRILMAIIRGKQGERS